MTRFRLSLLAAFLATVVTGPVRAEPYEALSTTAMGITGDIDLDESGIVFENGERLDFSEVVAEEIEVDGVSKPAAVFRIAEPANPELNGGNTLCGEAVTFLADWLDADGETLWVAAFTDSRAPISTEDLCASFTYVPKG